jgi:hypothetical protein
LGLCLWCEKGFFFWLLLVHMTGCFCCLEFVLVGGGWLVIGLILLFYLLT